MSDWDEEVFDGRDFEVLGSDEDPPKVSVVRRVAIGAVAAAVVGVAAGGYFAYGALSGGGSHADTVVPSTASAYVEIDLDPPAAQKIAAARFLHKFPALAKHLGSDTSNLGPSLVSQAFSDTDTVNFDRDVKPWLGNRVAVALVPNVAGHKLTYEIAVQVKDQAAAERLLPGLAAKAKKANAENNQEGVFYGSSASTSGDCPSITPSTDMEKYSCDYGASTSASSDPDPSPTGTDPLADDDFLGQSPEGWVLQDGYAILAPTQAVAVDLGKAAATADLTTSADYTADTSSLGDRVATVWTDSSGLGTLLGDELGGEQGLGGLVEGRTALAVKFTSSAAEVVGFTTSPSGDGSGKTTKLATLPADTMVGYEMTGAATLAKQEWTAYNKALSSVDDGDDSFDVAKMLKQEYDITMPDDLVSLVGTDVLVGVGSPASGAATAVSVRATVPDAATAHLMTVFHKLLSPIHEPAVTRTSDGLGWTTSKTYDAGVGTGSLGSSAQFQDAVPGVADATWALYVDWTKVAAATRDKGTMSHLGTLGVTMHQDGSRTQVFARLTGR